MFSKIKAYFNTKKEITLNIECLDYTRRKTLYGYMGILNIRYTNLKVGHKKNCIIDHILIINKKDFDLLKWTSASNFVFSHIHLYNTVDPNKFDPTNSYFVTWGDYEPAKSR